MADEKKSYLLEFKSRGMKTILRDLFNFRRDSKDTAGSLKKLISLLGVGFSVSKLKQYTQEWQQLTNMLKLVTDNEKELLATRNEILRISKDTRSDILATGKLYQRLAMQQDNLGASTKDLLNFTKGANIALATTAANASETRSVLLQLGQAMGTAAVNGDEFRSIAENAPRLLEAVADGAGIASGQIKRLTSEGKFLTRDFFDAVLTQIPTLEQELKGLDVTLGQAGQRFRNSVLIAIGSFGEVTKIASSVSSVIIQISDYIEDFAKNAAATASIFMDIFGELSKNMGTGKAFLKTMELAGGLFIDILVVGFENMKPIFTWIGDLIASSFYKKFVQLMPKSIKGKLITSGVSQLSKARKQEMVLGLSEQQYNSLFDYRKSDIHRIQHTRGVTSEELLKEAIKQGFFSSDDIIDAVVSGSQQQMDISMVALSTSFERIGNAQRETLQKFLQENPMFDIKKLGGDLGALIKARRKELFPDLALPDDEQDKILGFWGKLWEAIRGVGQAGEELKGVNLRSFSVGITEGFKEAATEASNFSNNLKDLTKRGIKGFSDELSSALVNGEADFKDFARSITADLVSMMIQAAITQAALAAVSGLSGLFTGGGTGAGQIGGRKLASFQYKGTALDGLQFGGYAPQGTPFIVGEQRPELFMPAGAGRVFPQTKEKEAAETNVRVVASLDPDDVIKNASPSVVDKLVYVSFLRQRGKIRGSM